MPTRSEDVEICLAALENLGGLRAYVGGQVQYDKLDSRRCFELERLWLNKNSGVLVIGLGRGARLMDGGWEPLADAERPTDLVFDVRRGCFTYFQYDGRRGRLILTGNDENLVVFPPSDRGLINFSSLESKMQTAH